MAALLWLGGLALAVLLTASAFEVVRLRRRVRLQAGWRTDLVNLVGLIGCVQPSDWPESIQAIMSQILARGSLAGAVLYSISESGHLERRIAEGAVAPEGAPEEDPLLRQAGDAAEPVFAPGGRRMVLPLRDGGDLVGLLSVHGARSGPGADPARAAYLQGAAHLLAIGLVNLRSHQRQAALSASDGLTGLHNHRNFHHLLGAALAQAYLQGEPLSVILFDIDHFKQVNDTYGHLFGDLVLREVAQVARRMAPRQSVVARYGGEEFAIALPGMPLPEAEAMAEHLRQTVANYEMLDFGTGARTRVTISLGVAEYQLGQGKDRLIARADEALYASKRGGRNRVTRSPVPVDSTTGDQ